MPSWRMGVGIVLDRGQLGYQVFPPVLPESTSPEVYCAILDIEEPRVGVEFVGRDRNLRLCELEHGFDLALCFRAGGVLGECLAAALVFGRRGLPINASDG